MRNRDNFPKHLKSILAYRSGNKCNLCKVATAGPHSDPEKFINIGEACHICAASPGGKRYNADQNTERLTIENAIWLCKSCHKIIDSDEKLYTVEKLKEMKYRHENEIMEELERKKKNYRLDRPILEFASIKMNHKKFWREIDKSKRSFAFSDVDTIFQRSEFKEIDPCFDIILLNHLDKSIIIKRIGFSLRGFAFLATGFGMAEHCEVIKDKEYEIIVPNFSLELQKIEEKYLSGILDQNEEFISVETLEEIYEPNFKGLIQKRFNNIDLLAMINLENEIRVSPHSSYKFGLLLKDFRFYHHSKISICVETNIDLFYSKKIGLNFMPE